MRYKKTLIAIFSALFVFGAALLSLEVLQLSPERVLNGLLVETKYTVGPRCRVKRSGGEPEPYCGELVTLAGVNVREAQLDIVTGDLEAPWAMEFIDNHRLLVTEVGGRIREVDVATGSVTTVANIPGVATGRGHLGLLDLALDPDFDNNRRLYFSYTVEAETGEAQYALAVARAEWAHGEVRHIQSIFTVAPYHHTTANFGGALLFDSEGLLLLGVGDRGSPNRAQNPGELFGKILRLNTDGSIPGTNPFATDNRYHPAIYALGVRNPQGMVRDPASGKIYETEHGPMGGDEINVLRAGANYGWPITTYGKNYDYKSLGLGSVAVDFEEPLFYYVPSIAISPIAIYHGDMFADWQGDLLVGALRGKPISKLDVLDDRIVSESRILEEAGARVRDIKVAPDGAILFVLEDGQLFRLWIDDSEDTTAAAPGTRSGKEVYELVCRSCHSITSPGIPKLRDRSAWKKRISKGAEQLYRNSIDGFGGMPARGHCNDCTDAEIRAAVDYMLGTVK